jgi:tetratricopeptide (TPR) repeat protein
MKNRNAAKTADGYATAFMIAAALPVILRLVAIALHQERLWGLDYLALFSPAWIAVFSAAALAPALPVGRRIAESMARTSAGATGTWLPAAILTIVAVLVLAFPMRTFYLGDGSIIVPEVFKLGKEPGYHSALLMNTQSAPLAGLLITAISVWAPRVSYAMGLGVPETSMFPFVILSLLCLAGLGGAVMLVRDRTERVVTLLGLLGLGGTLLLFGYVEFYPVVYVAIAAYMLAAHRYLDGTLSFWKLLLFYAVAVAAHYMTLALLPSLIYALLHRSSRLPRFAASAKGLAAVVAGVVLFGVGTYFALGLHDSPSRIVMPLVGQWSAAGVQSYTLLSPQHLLDLVNVPLLLCLVPVVFAVVVLLGKDRPAGSSPVMRFHAVAIAFFGVFLLFANMAFGLARDWDITAPLGLLVALAVYRAVLPRLAGSAVAGFRLALLSCLFIAPWIAANVDADRSTDRFGAIMALDDTRMFGDYALSGYEALRKNYVHAQDFEKEIEIERRMIDLVGYPEHYRLMLNTSLLFISRKPEVYRSTQRWMLAHLADAASRLRRGDARAAYAIGMKQIDSLATAIAAQATVYQFVDQFADGIDAVVAATGSRTPLLVRDGYWAVEKIDYPAGIAHLRAVLAADVHMPRVYALLGGALLAQRRTEEADAVFAEGFRRFPKEGELHYLVGLIYISERYRLADARHHLELSLELNPDAEKADQIRSILAQMSSLADSARK